MPKNQEPSFGLNQKKQKFKAEAPLAGSSVVKIDNRQIITASLSSGAPRGEVVDYYNAPATTHYAMAEKPQAPESKEYD